MYKFKISCKKDELLTESLFEEFEIADKLPLLLNFDEESVEGEIC